MSRDLVTCIAQAVNRHGQAYLVGGSVRDKLLGIHSSKDYDMEVFGMTQERLRELLVNDLELDVIECGKSFGVFKVRGCDLDISLPRWERKTEKGHTGFQVGIDPYMPLHIAAKRRDLTINAIYLDPLTGRYEDPVGGMGDIDTGILRCCDPERFGEDPLRALRVAVFYSRFHRFTLEENTKHICSLQDLSEVSAERIFIELDKLMDASDASRGFEFLKETGLIRFFPELQALISCPQEQAHHPEGDVWNHIMQCLDASDLCTKIVRWAVLCHDLGKATCTKWEGKWTSKEHDKVGAHIARDFLNRLRMPKADVKVICALIADHLSPVLFVKQMTGPKGYRRLARRLADAGATVDQLIAVAWCDQKGRHPKEFVDNWGEIFRQRMEDAVNTNPEQKDVVQGRHLIDAGLKPSAEFTEILQKCRDIQIETGWTDPNLIVDEYFRSL